MEVDYNNYAETFARSRQNMKWPEISYLLSFLEKGEWVIDVACWSGRLIQAYKEHFWFYPHYYYWIDASEKLLKEARGIYPWFDFFTWSMEDSQVYDWCDKVFLDAKKSIFCIAGLHHIMSLEDRLLTLSHWYNCLKPWETVCMTNWALESPRNKNTYKNALVQNSENEFWSHDFSIKIGKYYRWYHSFTLTELEYLASEAGFHIIENWLFSWEKNFITLLRR